MADRFGHSDVLMDLENRYAAGEISNRDVAEATACHYRGYSRRDIEACLITAPWIQGIRETVGILQTKGIPSLLCTVTWRFAARVVAEQFGFCGYSGTEMDEDEKGNLVGTVSRHFDEFDKREFVARYCTSHGIDASEVVAIGDSRSDIPLFGWVGFSIALNATAVARTAASSVLDTNDLRDVLSVVPGFLVGCKQ